MPWIWQFLKSTPLIFCIFTAVAVMVYLVANMVCGDHGIGPGNSTLKVKAHITYRDALNIRFVFASVPNSGPNSLFVFGRIATSYRIRIVCLMNVFSARLVTRALTAEVASMLKTSNDLCSSRSMLPTSSDYCMPQGLYLIISIFWHYFGDILSII